MLFQTDGIFARAASAFGEGFGKGGGTDTGLRHVFGGTNSMRTISRAGRAAASHAGTSRIALLRSGVDERDSIPEARSRRRLTSPRPRRAPLA